jgi:cyclic pyranopterin phosphate synthase
MAASKIRRQGTSARDATTPPATAVKHKYSPHATQSARLASLKSAKQFSEFLTDNFNRQHDYLRISVTERCNLRCLYCMPEEGVALSPPAHLLTTAEIVYLSSMFVSQGVTKIRLTGGEPTIRKDIIPMMQEIGGLRRYGLRELCITSNGISLYRKLDSMAEAGLTGVNLSLDTLDPFQFQIMTRRKGFEAVMKSIDRILEMNKLGAGIKLKINCVIMRGLNDKEIIPFVEIGREKSLEVRFIEYMPFDGNKWSQGKMFSYQEMLAVIREKYPTLERVSGHKNDTSKIYHIPGFEGRVGFITSMTDNFCGTCNRLRITSDGNLKVCLFGNTEVSLRDLIRKTNNGQPINYEAMDMLYGSNFGQMTRMDGNSEFPNDMQRELLEVIGAAVKRKKAKHAGMGELENMKNRPMILIDERERPVRDMKTYLTKRFRYPAASPIPSSPTRIPAFLVSLEALPSSRIRFHSTNSRGPKRSQGMMEGQSMASLPSTSDADLPHLTPSRTVHMTQIDEKPIAKRLATAICIVSFSNLTPYKLLSSGDLVKKGDVFSVARIAGIMAAKMTANIVPLCHPGIGITGVEVEVKLLPPPAPSETEQRSACGSMHITSTVTCLGRTGVEMEALTATVAAALTVYDMCKAVDKGMVIGEAKVIEKIGGRSGHWLHGQKLDNSNNPDPGSDNTGNVEK